MEDLLHINKTFEKIVAIGASIQNKEFSIHINH
jgi:predicted RNA-binding protein